MKIFNLIKEIIKILFEDLQNNDDCKYNPKYKSWKEK